MTEAELKIWIDQPGNLLEVIDKFFLDQPRSAVFMAGIPGAGKTEFVDNLRQHPYCRNFVTIEHDKLVEYLPKYKPENYYNYRSPANKLVSNMLRECLERGRSFIMDGTLAHGAGKDNIGKTLKRGYRVDVVYIVLDADKAWELTRKREKVTKRGIKESGFLSACEVINGKLLEIFDAYSAHPDFRFIYVDKKDRVDYSELQRVLDSTKPGEAGEIRKRLQVVYGTKS